MFVVITGVLWILYAQSRAGIGRDAHLLMRLQANELVSAIEREPDDWEALERYVSHHAALGYRDLQLGFRVFDPEQRLVLESGSLKDSSVPVPDVLPERAGEIAFEKVEAGETYPFFTQVVHAPLGGWVQVAVSAQLFAQSEREIRNVFLISLPVVLLLTMGLGFTLARLSLRPISSIIDSVEEVSATQLAMHVPESGHGDEVDRLASAFNSMTDRVGAGVLRMRRFSADAAHELRAPVTLMRNRLELARGNERDPERDGQLLDATLRDIDRLAGTIRAMLQLAHSEAGLDRDQLSEVSIRATLEAIVDFFEPLALDAEVGLRLVPSGDGFVHGDPTWLHQLFANLVDNAIKFTPPGGSVLIVVDPGPLEVVVVVEDTGVGVPEGEVDRIFESFHRAESSLSRKGSGLGLPLSREIARAHGGDVTLGQSEEKGSRFLVTLPVGGPVSARAYGAGKPLKI
ncbi:MAG: ATP-binding protein [Myxococcota bacterium]|nr:ATP-binding protein [Myxococcota bacterium]